MTSKRSHHLIKLLMLIGISIQQSISLQRYHRLTMYLILWLIKTLSYWKMVRSVCEITVTLDFIFRLVHCSSEDVSFNSICLYVLEGIKQFYLLVWFKKTLLDITFKGDNVKGLVKTSNWENMALYFSEKVLKITAFVMLFWFSVTKQSYESGFSFPQWSEIPTLPASLKIKGHFSTAAAFGNSVFF